jgi:hypothetical protein
VLGPPELRDAARELARRYAAAAGERGDVTRSG